MYCVRKVNNDLTWIGANDRRLAMFEGVFGVPDGISYNSYLLKDDQTVLFDTVDNAVGKVFFENLEYALGGKKLDYAVIHHMEPDHSATINELVLRYPDVKIICNSRTQGMLKQFFGTDFSAEIVKENDTLCTGRHTLRFFAAPMVHWPEVMVTYDEGDKILFSADAFGTFGALNGALFADEVDFPRDYLDEARRYYGNIVGKYGIMVQSLLTKLADKEIEYICPLHGFVWRKDINYYFDKYKLWANYIPEKKGVVIAYASVYGNTANAADILACMLNDRGVRTVMFDASVAPASEIIGSLFKYSHAVFASTTYNAEVFIKMDQLLRDVVSHNLQNRTFAFIENGSWAPVSAKMMREIVEPCKNIEYIEKPVKIKSAVNDENLAQLTDLADAVADSVLNK